MAAPHQIRQRQRYTFVCCGFTAQAQCHRVWVDIQPTYRHHRVWLHFVAQIHTLRPLFGSNPVLSKIRNGEPVSEAELEQLNSLIHTLNPDVDLHTLAEFYADTAVPLAQILRSLVGMDGAAVEARFTAFAQKHPFISTQLRFLDMLKEHIALAGTIRLEQLFQAPFTRIHDEGITGVFALDGQLEELIGIVRSFGEPPTQPSAPKT